MSLSFLRRWLPLRVIGIDGVPYLERYYVCGNAPLQHWPTEVRPRLAWLPCAVYLHRILRPDEARDLHNHPWPWSFALVLRGGYTEEVAEGVERPVRPGRLNFLGTRFHRIATLLRGPAWTLFVHGTGKARDWGFRDRASGAFTPHKLYFLRGDAQRWARKVATFWVPRGRDDEAAELRTLMHALGAGWRVRARDLSSGPAWACWRVP